MFRTPISAAILTCALATGAFAQAGATVTEPEEFAMMAASSNMFEIESSELALQKIEGGDVATVAQQMVDDHTAAGEKMKAAASEDRIPLPAAMSEKHQSVMEQLQAADGDAFAAAYIDVQVTAHKEAVTLFSGYSTGGEEGALKSFAAETLPTLQMHETHVKELSAP